MIGPVRTLVAFLVAVVPSVAVAQTAAPENPKLVLDKGQIQAGGAITYGQGNGIFDGNGHYESIGAALAAQAGPGASGTATLSVLVVDLHAAYGIANGIEAGLHLPFVQNSLSGTINAGGGSANVSNTGSGIGDLWVYGSYEARLAPLNVSGTLSIKLPTGKADNLSSSQYAVGSGQTDIGLGVNAAKAVGPAVLDGHLGYVYRMEGSYTVNSGAGSASVKIKPGDVVYLDLGASHWFSPKFAARLGLDYYTSQSTQQNGSSAPNSAANALTVVPSVTYRASPKVDVSLAGGFQRIGLNGGLETFSGSGPPGTMETGYPIMGANDLASGFGLTLGVNAIF